MTESTIHFTTPSEQLPLCNSVDLQDGGLAVPFDVVYAGQTCRAFAIRFEGQVQVFDRDGQWLVCSSHGAEFSPETGDCVGGPCNGGLVKIPLSEESGVVHWHTAYNLKPLAF
jgi:hypothetical protein